MLCETFRTAFFFKISYKRNNYEQTVHFCGTHNIASIHGLQ